tara:strand:- start:95 stop:376 length:282 start_codon:yes stop_codon:yes gene_type:complete
MEFLMNNLNLLAGGGAGAVALWVLKKIPNEDLYAWVESCTYIAGVTLTLGLAKWKLTKKIWNSTIEPYFVDLIENTVGAAVKGLLDGLRSDNK